MATWAWVSGSGALVVIAWWLAGVCVVKAITPKAAPSDATDADTVTGAEDLRVGPGVPSRDVAGR
jgi:hypothetical protein